MRIDNIDDVTASLSWIKIEFRNLFCGFTQNWEIRIVPFLLIPYQIVSEFLHGFEALILNPEKIL